MYIAAQALDILRTDDFGWPAQKGWAAEDSSEMLRQRREDRTLPKTATL
jgi:hypothetical protein